MQVVKTCMNLKYAPPAAAGGVFFVLLGLFPRLQPVAVAPVTFGLALVSAFSALVRLTRTAPGEAGDSRISFGPRRYPVAGHLLAFALGLSLCAASDAAAGFVSNIGSHGQATSGITGCEVLLTGDPTVLTGKRWMAEGRLVSTASESLTTRATGAVVLYGRGGVDGLASGGFVETGGSFLPAGEGEAAVPVFRVEQWHCIGWSSRVREVRYRLICRLEAPLARFNGETSVCYSALLLGRRTDPGSAIIRNFGSAGCMHLLALSGFHLGLIAILALRIFGLFLDFRNTRIAALLLVSLYVFLAGPRPSLIRAWLMFTFSILASLKHVRIPGVEILSLAFIVQVVLFPAAVQDVGFQLSYTALLGILVSGNALASLMRRRFRAAFLLSAGISAQGYTMPIVVAVFGIWRPVGIPASLVMTPLLLVSMVGGSVLILAGAAGIPVPDVLWNCGNISVELLGKAAEFFGRFPGVKLTEAVSWLIAAGIVIIPLVLQRRLRYEKPDHTEPRLPGLDPVVPRQQGTGPQEALGTEFPDQQRSPRQDNRPVEREGIIPYMGDRSRPGSDE